MGIAAAPLSLASLGMQAAGTGLGAFGSFSADKYQSEALKLAAQEGELQATQTNAQLTARMNQTLGNIDAVRAAAHTDPSSPTGAQARGTVEGALEQQKTNQVDTILAQSYMDESQSQYLASASSMALLSGGLGMAGGLLKGISGLPGLAGGIGATAPATASASPLYSGGGIGMM